MSSKSSSSTQANQTQVSTTQDNRVNAAEGSVVLSQATGNSISSDDHSTTIYQSTDKDATKAALDGAAKITDGALSSSFDFAESVAKGAADMMAASTGKVIDANVKVTTNALGAVQSAYKDSTGKISDAYNDANASVSKAWSQASGATVDMANTSISAIKSASQHADDMLASAWQSSKAGEQKMLSYVAVAAVALVAFRAVGGR